MAKNKMFGKKKKNQERLGTFTPLPAGEYPCRIVESDIEKTKSGDGKNLVIKWEILKGPEKGKSFKTWISFENDSEKAVGFALKTMASICDAVEIDYMKFDNPKDILKKRLNLVLSVTSGDGNFGPKNEIRKYKEFSANVKADKKGKGKKKGKKKDKPF